ncbi:MAG TPA: hypothetical protein VFC84_01490 [Desulfosporosinus sp.]|nr:hypothetical protein [Desulfosporosinus sp.]
MGKGLVNPFIVHTKTIFSKKLQERNTISPYFKGAEGSEESAYKDVSRFLDNLEVHRRVEYNVAMRVIRILGGFI